MEVSEPNPTSVSERSSSERTGLLEVCSEAKRVMAQALRKLSSCRNQRGGIPLRRSLLLTLVIRAARDAYCSARVPAPSHGPDTGGQGDGPVPAARLTRPPGLMDTTEAPEAPCALQSGDGTLKRSSTADKENRGSTGRPTPSRKRSGKSGAQPESIPCKKPRLDPAEPRRLLHESTARRNCGRNTEPVPATHIPRTIVTC